MPVDPDVTVAEIWRRIESMQREQREQFIAMNARLDKMLTTDGLASYMGTHAAELRHLRKDHDDLETETKVRFERHETKMTAAVRWAIGALIAAMGVIVAAVGQFWQAVSG